ncbi:hypothetical protein EAH89_30595 [Roseomonas nepalensis]|uniref:Uncharacterized protein n=1 Tax=Muricoccus nepalensis TaxID=1854500 RepID=A0A502EAX4_9PROT|nr:hypothetical protein [Roseomonas nepalensis]TPG34875.1 hypothetical protein EAH89_30595 [Roseomonas nepalensis]
MRRSPFLTLALPLLLLAGCPADAHRPYFTHVERIVLPDGQPGEMRLLKGDGILLADPVRILVLDRDGRLLARSHQSGAMVLLCDRDRRSCRGYDGAAVLLLDPASFRHGQSVPGLTDAERSGLLAFETGDESWGFVIRRASLADRIRAEAALARETPCALALLVALGVVAGLLIPARLPRAEDPAEPRWSVWSMWTAGVLLRLTILAPVLLVASYVGALVGLTSIAWLTGFGSGAALVLFWHSRRRRRVTVSPTA